MAAPVDHPRLGPTHMVASPLNLTGLDKPIGAPAPLTAEDTEAVLAEIGYTEAEIAAMKADAVI
jgi:crotonobetainyl-CoA:carnitine CoA-transferase CaiB-like acyl-CoA transferase